MASDSSKAVENAVIGRLRAASGLTSLLRGGAAGIGKGRKHAAELPAVVLSEIRLQSLSTQTHDGCDLRVTIDSYASLKSGVNVRDVMAATHIALHRAHFSISGHHLILCQHIASESVTEASGESERGRQVFQIITEPST